MRYFLKISYNGRPFHGWQSQPNAESVQSVIERSLSTVLRRQIAITGAGRTDTGVHARTMYAHFDSEELNIDQKKFILSLNRLCGKFIRIIDIFKVDDSAHARFDALERTYKYFVTFEKNPFEWQFCWHSPTLLDKDLMNEGARILLDTKDFTSFAKLHSDAKTNICDVREAIWQNISQDKEATGFLGNLNDGIVFTIKADRFLRNMVRAIVGTLIDIGRGKLSVENFVDIINKKDRCCAGTSMPADGLFLWDIKYPERLIL